MYCIGWNAKSNKTTGCSFLYLHQLGSGFHKKNIVCVFVFVCVFVCVLNFWIVGIGTYLSFLIASSFPIPPRNSSINLVYGADGIRRNTRAVRWRERYTNQRQDALEKILSMTSAGHNPNAVAPSLFRRRRTRKIHIPVEQHPTYNFIGLIIGPRGKTQKEMETKTGCKIAIRGKGSVKEGARGRRDGKSMDGDDEPLHVVITGDNQGNVDAAADMVEQMLVVIDDDKNVHKQNQLRELALLNGTLKDEEFCAICSERGHRSFECPKRFSGSKGGAVSVKCALCGDTSHPTRDCALNKKGAEIGDLKEGESEKGGASAVEDGKKLDSDYLSFMAELDGKPPPSNEDNISAVTSINPVVTINAPAVPLPSSSDFVITTISSRIVQPGEQNDEGNGNNIETVGSGMGTAMGCGSHNALTTSEGVDALGNGTLPPPSAVHTIVNAVSLPPPPPSSSVLDPSISILPPLPVVPAVTVAVGTLPPQLPPHPVISNLPPPPSLPPPLSVAHQYQGYGMQQAYYPPPPVGGIGVGVGGFGVGGAPFSPPGGHFGGYVPQQNIHGPGHGQDHGGGGPPNQDLSHGKQSGNSGAWDYKSYYGTEDKGGDAEGAGGFNWWES